MTSRVVCDASAVLSALLDSGEDGQWATARIADRDLYAPTLLPFECANVMRRRELAGSITSDQAVQAHSDLLDLAIDYCEDVLIPEVEKLKQGKPVLGLNAGVAYDQVIDDAGSDSPKTDDVNLGVGHAAENACTRRQPYVGVSRESSRPSVRACEDRDQGGRLRRVGSDPNGVRS